MSGEAAGVRPLRIHAVVRAGWSRPGPEGGRLVEGAGLAAAVRETASPEESDLQAHVRRVEALHREVTLVPAPPGLIARDEAAVRRFLRRARLPLLDALDLFEDCWELRLHLGPRGPGGADPDGAEEAGSDGEAPPPEARARGEAERIFRAVRRRARACRRLAPGGDDLLSAACLVSRARWIDFVEEATAREAGAVDVAADVTGPWAPWDFVRMFPERTGPTPSRTRPADAGAGAERDRGPEGTT